MSNDSFINSLIIAKAAMLARQGMLSKAEELLTPMVQGEGDSIEAVNLLAKIHAQQGSIPEAKDLWTRILERDPYNTAAAKALERCVRLRERRRRPRMNYLVHLSVVAVAGVIAAFLWIQPPAGNGEWLASPFTALGNASGKTAAADEAGEESPATSPSLKTSQGENGNGREGGEKASASRSWMKKILASLPFYTDPSPMAGLTRTARTERIEQAVRENSQFQGMDLQVGEDQGSIYVVGAVPTWPVRRRVERYVKEQAGKVYVDVNKVILTGVYVTQAGDTPRGVAEKLYGTASQASKIMELNHLPMAGGLRAGMKLILPGTASPASRR
ncbi:MAG: tetratricopeptide repeat protein [bacterium]